MEKNRAGGKSRSQTRIQRTQATCRRGAMTLTQGGRRRPVPPPGAEGGLRPAAAEGGGCPAHSAQAEIHIACGSRGVCGSSQGTSVSAGSERTRPHKRTALRSSSAPHTLNPPVSSCRGAARAREGDPKRHVHAWALRGTGARPRSTGAPAETQPCLAVVRGLVPRHSTHSEPPAPSPAEQSTGGGRNHAFGRKRCENLRIRKNVCLIQGQNPAPGHLSLPCALTQTGRVGSVSAQPTHCTAPLGPGRGAQGGGCRRGRSHSALGACSQPSGPSGD